MEPIEIEIPRTETEATPTSSFNLSLLKDLTDRFMALSSRDKLYAVGGALFLVGVIAVCAAGGTTCSSFTVVNELDTTLYISRLSPYTAHFNDADKHKPHNHPRWKYKSFFEDGAVDVSVGFGDEIDMRIEDYYGYPFNSAEEHGHVILSSKQDQAPIFTGDIGIPAHLETGKGFWACNVYLKQGAPQPETNTTAVTKHLRG